MSGTVGLTFNVDMVKQRISDADLATLDILVAGNPPTADYSGSSPGKPGRRHRHGAGLSVA